MGRKRVRGSRGAHSASVAHPSQREAYDLMVPMPKGVRAVQSQLQIRKMLDRLESVGYTHVALTHTIYGRPRLAEDAADKSIPNSFFTTTTTSKDDDSEEDPNTKKQKTGSSNRRIQVLRRLHAVLENLSDVAVFLSNGPFASLLNEYDVVSVSPRNEATFQSVCASATVADIITLDYSARGLRLPYRIRQADVQAVSSRNAAFEIPYAPALLHTKQRKALVQACRELQNGAGNAAPSVLFSSGDRTFEDSDVGDLALRMPGDLINLMETVLQFDQTTSLNALKRNGKSVLKRAETRRWGKSDVDDVRIETVESLQHHPHANDESEGNKKEVSKAASPAEVDDDGEDEEDPEDGFIAM